MKEISDEEFLNVCKNSLTMFEAYQIIGEKSFSTFKRRAKKLNCYVPNRGGKNKKKLSLEHINKIRKYSDEQVLNGIHNLCTSQLKGRLFLIGIKENKCEICGISEWLNKKINCELHHIDGNRKNNVIANLQILCPNCHSQTDTYAGRNNKK
jgi:hypothetical protein